MKCPRCQGFVFILHQEKRCVNCGWHDYNYESAYDRQRVPYTPSEDRGE